MFYHEVFFEISHAFLCPQGHESVTQREVALILTLFSNCQATKLPSLGAPLMFSSAESSSHEGFKLECKKYKVLNFKGPKGGIFERQMEGRVKFYMAES